MFNPWPKGQVFLLLAFRPRVKPRDSETADYVDGRPGGLTGAGQQSTGHTSWLAGN